MRPVIRIGLVVIVVSLIVWYYQRSKQNGPATELLNIRMEAAPNNLNPFLTSSGYSSHIAALIFQTLGITDPQSYALKPALVKAIPAVRPVTEGAHQGERAYDFEINGAATWENGTSVTAEDFVFTMKLIFHQGLPDTYRKYFEYVSGVEVDPANARKFTVFMRQYYILTLEALCTTPIYPRYNYDSLGRMTNIPLADLLDPEKGKAFAESENGKAFAEVFTSPKFASDPQYITGSGPYRIKSMNGDQGLVLVKKKGWWGNQEVSSNPLLAAYPEQLVFKFVKDETAAQNLLQTGDLDIATDISPALFKAMQQDTHFTRLYDFKTGWVPRYGRILINLRQPDSNLLADVRVRKALAYAIDYDYLLNTVQQGYAKPIAGPIHPSKAYYAKDLSPYTYNPTEAKRLLSEAGWADTDQDGILDKVINGRRVPLSLKLLTSTGTPVSEMTAESIKDKARQIQIEIVLDPQEISTIIKNIGAGNFQLANSAAVNQIGLDELTQPFHSTSAMNRGRYQNPQLDSIIDAIRTTENEPVRNALYVKAQHIIHDDVPVVFLYAAERRYIISKKLDYVLTADGLGFYEQLFHRKAENLK